MTGAIVLPTGRLQDVTDLNANSTDLRLMWNDGVIALLADRATICLTSVQARALAKALNKSANSVDGKEEEAQ